MSERGIGSERMCMMMGMVIGRCFGQFVPTHELDRTRIGNTTAREELKKIRAHTRVSEGEWVNVVQLIFDCAED